MKRALVLLALFLSAGVVEAQYPPLMHAWNTSIGGGYLELRDITGDLTPEIIVGLFGGEASYVYVLNNEGQLVWKNKLSVIWPQNDVHCFGVDDLDLNGNPDIVVGSEVRSQPCILSSSPYKTPLYMLERQKGFEYNTLKWQLDDTGYALSLYVADISGDTKKEVVLGNREADVYAVSSGGNIIWKYSAEGSVNSMYVADLRGDGSRNIIAGSFRRVHVLSSSGTLKWQYTTNSNVKSLYAFDVDSDNRREVLAVTEDNNLYVLRYNGTLMWKYKLPDIRDTVAAGDVDGDNDVETILVSGEAMYALNSTGHLEFGYRIDEPLMKVSVMNAGAGNETAAEIIALTQRKLYSFRINPAFISDRTADRRYEKAAVYYGEKRYEDAIKEALEASAAYAELGDVNSTAMSNLMVNRSTDYIQANKLYLDALKFFNNTEYENAKKTAQDAYKVYEKLGDNDMMNLTFGIVKDSMDYMDAQYFYKQSLDLYRKGLYDEAKAKGRKALEMYLLVNDTYWIRKSSDLVIRGNNYKNASQNFEEALNRYNKAEYLKDREKPSVVKGEYLAAREKAITARKYYETVDDSGFVQNVSNLISAIEDTVRTIETLEHADASYELATKYFNSSRYEECETQARGAMDLYYNVDRFNKTVEVYDLIVKCNTGLNATMFYQKAVEYRAIKEYDLALDYAKKAREMYRAIGNLDGAIKCGELIVDVESSIRRERLEARIAQLIQVLMPVVVFAVTIVLVLSIPVALFILRYRERIFGELRRMITEGDAVKRLKDAALRKEEPLIIPAEKGGQMKLWKKPPKPKESATSAAVDDLEVNILDRGYGIEPEKKAEPNAGGGKGGTDVDKTVETLVDAIMERGDEEIATGEAPATKPAEPAAAAFEAVEEKPPEPEKPKDLSNAPPAEISERLRGYIEKINRALYKKGR